MSHRDYVDSAHGGDGWQPRQHTTTEEKGKVLGQFGQETEYDALESVVLHAPEPNAFDFTLLPHLYHFDAVPNIALACEQHYRFAELLREHGVTVHELKPLSPRPNHIYVRDLFTMTPLGAIISRMATAVRAGEEQDAATFLANHRIPIVRQILGSAVFEGPDLVFPRPGLALVATSIRSNSAGVDQVISTLVGFGIECVKVDTAYGCGHLDGVLNIVAPDKALVIPRMVSFGAIQTLRKCGFKIIDLTDREEISRMAINVLTVNHELAFVPADCFSTMHLLESEGVRCVPVDISELRKGGGGLHCMTGVIARGRVK